MLDDAVEVVIESLAQEDVQPAYRARVDYMRAQYRVNGEFRRLVDSAAATLIGRSQVSAMN